MKIIQNSIIKQIIPLFLLISILFNSCGFYKRADVKDFPIKDSEKRKKNIDEGRGVTFGTVLGGKKVENLILPHLMKCGEQLLLY